MSMKQTNISTQKPISSACIKPIIEHIIKYICYVTSQLPEMVPSYPRSKKAMN